MLRDVLVRKPVEAFGGMQVNKIGNKTDKKKMEE